MYLVSYVPPLWSYVMNPRLLDVVQHDPSRINFDPKKRAQLMQKYALVMPVIAVSNLNQETAA